MSARGETLLTLFLLLVCVGLAGWSLWPHLRVQQVSVTRVQPEVTVSVAGAVAAPGVYTLPWGSRVEGAVEVAGGFTDGAERTLVNLADPLTTGETVFVPGALTAEGEVRVSVNSASERELDLLLPGVGPVLAARIAAARPFATLEDLLEVSGIGPATLEKLRPLVKL